MYDLIRPLLFAMDAESAHDIITGLMASPLGPVVSTLVPMATRSYPALQQELLGRTLPNPVGLAAGLDKHVQLVEMARWLGCGFHEVGAITAQASQGNPKPRLFRLPTDHALINRMGLNNAGAANLKHQLKALPKDFCVGINLSKTPQPHITGPLALQDFGLALKHALGCGSYISLDVSCPNTADGTTFCQPDTLAELLAFLANQQQALLSNHPTQAKPWLVKLSPDLTSDTLAHLVDVAQPYVDKGLMAGWVACNTTRTRDNLTTDAQTVEQLGPGGLSGPPVFDKSLAVVRTLYQLTGGQHLIVGVGGIRDTESAWAYMTHGASLIQLYTGLVYEGPGLVERIKAGLDAKLKQHGLTNIAQAVGLAHRHHPATTSF
ncbi:MAG: quinone-dependent dihydroorotate dehydrogenase [Cyanobacteria bacterium HKST-UBA03]|nr:quinone-dependent dihydroorotate dehydrogenase [Cyanobacteria bacterium HKST-UBA03]